MNSVFSAGYTLGELVLPKLTAVESATLVLLAAALLVFRTFRERYLLIWILGWVAYDVSVSGHLALSHPNPYLEAAISQAGFVLALSLFASGTLVYCHARKVLSGVLVLSALVIGCALARQIFFPDSGILRVAFEVAYRMIPLTAALQLIRFRWARWEIGTWLLSASLLLMHLDWAPLSDHLPAGFNLVAALFLGMSMLLVVLDDSRARTQRLAVVNALTTSITRAREQGPMMVTALEELKRLMLAEAAWFRMVEGEKMVIVQQIGLSPEFMHDRGSVPLDDKFEDTLSHEGPILVKTSSSDELARFQLKKEGFHHCVLVPVRGKKSIIGVLTLGSRHHLAYTPDEMEFLETTAHQLGLAVENLRLVEQIVRSHRQWANTFDSIQDFVLVHDADFRILKANRALLERLGLAPADAVDQLCETVLPKKGKWSDCPYCLGSDEIFHEAPDPCFGGFSVVSTSSYVEQGKPEKGTVHVVRDTTDRRVAEENYRLLFEQAQEGVFVASPDGALLDCNDALVRMLGYSKSEEIMALALETEIYAFPSQREAFHHEIDQNDFVRNFEVTLRHKDGALLTVLESTFVTRDANGRIERYQGFLLDITEKKRAEDEIRRRNRELNALNAMAVIATQSFDLDEILNLTLRQVVSLVGTDGGSIYLADPDGTKFRRRATWGQRSADRARFSEVELSEGFGDLVTRSRTEVITPEFLPHLPATVAEFIKGETSGIWVLLWSKDRCAGIMGLTNRQPRTYTENDENLLVAIGRQLATTIERVRLYDETSRAYDDLRRTQEQLLQSEKMSAVGQLIAGVAHELNNPLTAILGYAQLLQSEGLAERAADFVNKLFKQAQRTHRVVQNLLSFARQRKPHKQTVDISKVLEETLALRDYDLRVNDIKLERETDAQLPAVTADPHQLEQVFLNIINNAVDAMLESGKGGRLKVTQCAKDGHIHIEFHDNGPGIKEPNRIFEPFYTTKSVGKGTGLGLSICYGIIQEHGGRISAHNPEEGGAAITVVLPSAGAAAPAEEPRPALSPRPSAIEGRIILVEDEESILEFERDVLIGAGADVVTCMKGEDLKTLLQNQSFDALIMGGKIPGTGTLPEVQRWIAENCSTLEKHWLVTFSSAPEPEIRNFLQEQGVPYLMKPFEVSDLIVQTRRLLQKAQAAAAN
jgi:PAS domain S-box-containing protein